MENQVLRYGMVGGGRGAFIGDVHRKAAAMDGKCQLSAGCFSRNHKNTLETGERLGVDKDRCYQSFEEMAAEEAKRGDGIDFVSIVTPNKTHYAIAKAFLGHGIHVVCDKPLTIEVDEARELEQLAKEKDVLFCVTYAYTGYPIVKHAREMLSRGELGEIQMIMAEYPQDWVINQVGNLGEAQLWRTDSEEGKSACVADIGCHIENTISYITGLEIDSLCARLDNVGEGMELDTNASIMLKYNNGASGIYWASQIALGNKNALKVRVFGSRGSLEWEQERPDDMKLTYFGKPVQMIYRGRDKLYPSAEKYSRIPGGHPEGTYEAFANIYLAFTNALLKKKAGEKLSGEDLDFPDVEQGVKGVQFIEACLQSNQEKSSWVECK